MLLLRCKYAQTRWRKRFSIPLCACEFQFVAVYFFGAWWPLWRGYSCINIYPPGDFELIIIFFSFVFRYVDWSYGLYLHEWLTCLFTCVCATRHGWNVSTFVYVFECFFFIRAFPSFEMMRNVWGGTKPYFTFYIRHIRICMSIKWCYYHIGECVIICTRIQIGHFGILTIGCLVPGDQWEN